MTSPHAPRRLTIATRESALAMWQARHVQSWLEGLYPGASVGLLGMTTQGDQVLDRPLAAIGGKGLFVKELEVPRATYPDSGPDIALRCYRACTN